MFGCEREAIVSEQDLAEQLSANFEWAEPIPESANLADIQVSVVDGVLSFASVKDFRVAVNVFAKATDEEYLTWSNTISGFSPQFIRYQELVEMMERREGALTIEDLTKADRQFVRIDEEGRPSLRFPSRTYARILNYEGKVLIDGDLNIFNESYHMMIDQADPEKLNQGLATLTTDFQAGIIVENVEIIDESGSITDQKVLQANIDCPIIQNNSGIQVSSRTDKQTLSGSKQELRSNLFFTAVILGANNATGEFTVVYQTFIDYENWRRQGLTWKRTQPNTLGSYLRDDNSNSIGYVNDVLRVDRIQQIYSPTIGNVTVASTLNATVSRHGVFNNARHDANTPGGEKIEGQNGGTYLFDDTELTGFFTPGTGIQRSSIYTLVDGTASVRWTNRGNNVQLDPMSTEFNCQ